MLFRDSSIYILAKVVPGLMAFVALSLYTHFLSPDEYGIYTLIISGTILLHNVVFNWIPAGTLRFWSSGKHDSLTFTSTIAITYVKLALSLLIIVIFLIISTFWHDKFKISWILTTYFLLLAQAIFAITQCLFSAKIQPLSYAYISIAYSLFALVLGTLNAYLNMGATGVIAGIIIGTLTPAILVFKKIWSPFKQSAYDPDLFKKLLFYGLPFASAALLEEVTKVSDRFMLAGFHSKAEAGLYAVGYDLSGNSILMIMAAINLAAYPVIIKLLETDGKKAAMDYFRQYSILLLGVSIPSVIGLNMIGPDLVYLLISEQYQESVIYLLPWVTLAVFMMGIQATYFDISFQLGHQVITVAQIGIVVALVNLALNFWLIPDMGLHGAAIATLSSFTIGSILSAILGRKCFALPFAFSEFIKILVSSLVMGFCLWWLRDLRGWGWLIIQLFTGIISYLIMIYIFNILDAKTYIRQFVKNKLSR